MANLASINKNSNDKNLVKKRRATKKKRRTAVSSSSSSSSSSSDDDNSEEEDEDNNKKNTIENVSDNEMEIEVDLENKEEQVPELSNPIKKSKLIRDNIQLSDSELKQNILQNQALLNNMPVSEFISLYNINTVSDLKKIEQNINKKSKNLSNPPIDKTLKNKFLTEVFKNYSDDIDSLREANDFNSKHSLSLLANLLKDGASMFDKDTLESILQ